MTPIHYIQFSYLGINRFVICDLDTPYEEVRKLVAETFQLPEEYITAIQFTDGKGYTFSKDIFEYFMILFPQPEQKFYVRFECSKIVENRAAGQAGIFTPIAIKKNTNKRTHDMQNADDSRIHYAAPVRRQNCFIGSLPACNEAVLSNEDNQSPKRMRLMKSSKKMMKRSYIKRIKPPQPKRTLRL